MKDFSIIEIFTSVGGFAGLIAFLKELYKIYMRQKVYSLEFVQRSQLAIYKELAHVVENTSADKVLVLYLHNGGSKPAVGKPLYSSALYEVNQSDMTPRISMWNKQRVDKQYTQMLVDMINSDEKSILIETEKMESGILKDVYRDDEIKWSKINFLASHNPKGFWRKKDEAGKTWYMSTVFRKEKPNYKDRVVIRAAVSTIAKTLKDQYKYD